MFRHQYPEREPLKLVFRHQYPECEPLKLVFRHQYPKREPLKDLGGELFPSNIFYVQKDKYNECVLSRFWTLQY